MITTRSLAYLGIAASCFATLAFSEAAHALTINLGTISSAATISSSIPYTTNELVTFKFKVLAPYSFNFMATGSGGAFLSRSRHLRRARPARIQRRSANIQFREPSIIH